MNDYSSRYNRSETAEADFDRWAKSIHLTTTPTAVEKYWPQSVRWNIVSLNAGDPGWNYWRYMPDRHAITPDHRQLWIEIKAGQTIERDAYTHYLTLDAHQPVHIFFHRPATNEFRVVRASRITFEQSDWQPPTTSSGTFWKRVDWGRTPYHTKTIPQQGVN